MTAVPVSSLPIPQRYSIRPIKSFQCKEWLLEKHYAKRIPPISYAFGLYNGDLEGICTFGIPASRFELGVQPFELNRLCVNDGLEKNVLSYFVSQCLKQFPEEAIIVSYADPNNGHHGYIYQATNWIYTGESSAERRMFVDGTELHRKTLYNLFGTSSVGQLNDDGKNITFEEQDGKHRYFWCSNKKLRKVVIEKFPVLPYPKGDNRRYDASYAPTTQRLLF